MMMFCSDTVIPVNKNDLIVIVSLMLVGLHSVLPPRDQGGGMIFVSSARQGGQLLNFKSQSGDTFRGKMILGSQAGGELLYHDELLVFPQNASVAVFVYNKHHIQ